MLIKEKIGNLSSFADEGKAIDRLPLEWFECSKRILHKKTGSGREIILKLLNETGVLQQDDVLYADEKMAIVVEVLACEVMVVKPASMYEMAMVSYEIGNKHLPLFYEAESLLIPYDAPTHRLLQGLGYNTKIEKRKLLNQLRSTVSPHAHSSGESLFSKILKLSGSSSE
jgi:urease accessory protein